MDKKDLILAGIVAACVLGLVLTRGSGDSQQTATVEPAKETDVLQSHTIEHFLVHDIHISEATDAEVRAMRDQGKIKVEINPDFLATLPDTFLASLGWEKPVNWVSDQGFEEFLEVLHLQIAPDEDDGWEMEGDDHEAHNHDHEGHDHEGHSH